MHTELPRRQRRVVAVANQKGGAGKTQATVHLAVSLAQLDSNYGGASMTVPKTKALRSKEPVQKYRVLVIDIDAQGNASTHLGCQSNGDALLDVLRGATPLVDAIEKSEFGVDVLCGGPALEGLDVVLFLEKKHSAVFALKQALDAAPDLWDFVLIDCPPNLGTATGAALLAATEVLIPVQAGGEALEGTGRLMNNINEVRSVNPSLRLLGLLPCMTNSREMLTQQVEATLHESFGDLVLPGIKRNAKIGQSFVARKPMHVFDQKSPSVKQYQAVARAIVERREERP